MADTCIERVYRSLVSCDHRMAAMFVWYGSNQSDSWEGHMTQGSSNRKQANKR